jgi:hypothetical protein
MAAITSNPCRQASWSPHRNLFACGPVFRLAALRACAPKGARRAGRRLT